MAGSGHGSTLASSVVAGIREVLSATVATVYYLALLNPRDQHASVAALFTADFSGAFVTSAWVLTEVATLWLGAQTVPCSPSCMPN